MKQNKAKCSNNLLFSFAKRSKNEEKWFLFHFVLFLNEKNKKGKWDNLDAGGSSDMTFGGNGNYMRLL